MLLAVLVFGVALFACTACKRQRPTEIELPNETKALPPVEASWTRAGDLLQARSEHVVIALADGSALVAGGAVKDGKRIASVERFDPAANKWEKRAPMPSPVAEARAVVLRDGRVLVCGGRMEYSPLLDRCVLYDPTKDEWRAAASMPWPRLDHELVLLKDGTVLAVGGKKEVLAVAAETAVYDPGRDAWAPSGSLAHARVNHTATLLTDGRVAVIGGEGTASNTRTGWIELFDPAKRAWTNGGVLAAPRSSHVAILRRDGMVLVTGGETEVAAGDTPVEKSSAVYDPATRTVGAGPAAHRRSHGQGVPLADGRVLLLGSVDENIKESPPLIIDAAKSGSALATPWPRKPGVLHDRVAVALKDGRVLAAGGHLQSGGETAETWLFALK
jgi:hypothetical protein